MARYVTHGQCLDVLSNPPNGRPKFHLFTRKRYENIVKYKTSYYTFVLPVKLGININNRNINLFYPFLLIQCHLAFQSIWCVFLQI